ncbi:hypothetical protein [Dactylosporangium sp. CA-139066]|uniref:hypothetical protein n=1 Tax=Dactylosporangium sp. CA-139066 TaxID=3239930 RepID=UPI003D8C46E4
MDRVLGGGPLREIGRPRVVAIAPGGDRLAIGGELGRAQWHGHDVAARSRSHRGWYPLAVYRADDLSCEHLVTTGWPANAIAFHPTLPLVAVGTGSYDGGWSYEGELVLLDLTTGAAVSLLQYPREVRRVAWADPQTLDLVLAVPCDEDEEQYATTSLACSIRRDDWDRATARMLRAPYGETPVPDGPRTDPAAGAAIVEELCRERGRPWAPRRAVWAVESLPGGRILAALEGVRLECWSPTSDEPLWRLPSDGTGCQVKVRPGARTALVLTQTPNRFEDRGWTHDPSVVTEVDLADGAVLATHEPGSHVVLVTRADGGWAWRDAEFVPEATGTAVVHAPGAAEPATVAIGRYDLFNHYFDIRRAPDLLFLQGREDKPSLEKWVVTSDGRRLFPLEWDAARGKHLFGGCGAYLEDASGPSLVHAGAIHDWAGLLKGNAFVVRRAYPGGELQWVFTADCRATALDADEDFVYVAFNDGELVVLRAGDGSVYTRRELRIDGHRAIPLSLARLDPGRLAIGTLDGRIVIWPVQDQAAA